jgi:hypothetical protein
MILSTGKKKLVGIALDNGVQWATAKAMGMQL